MAEESLIDEYHARTGDLERINSLFADDSQDTYEGFRRNLLTEVINRNNVFFRDLEQTGFQDLDSIPSVNQEWQDAIFRMGLRAALIKEHLANELAQRTKDLETVINVLTGAGDGKDLEVAIANNKSRHEQQSGQLQDLTQAEDNSSQLKTYDQNLVDDNQTWEDLLYKAQNVPKNINPSALAGDFAPLVTKTLMDELAGRTGDLEKLKKIDKANPAEVETLVNAAEQRHDQLETALAEAAENGTEEEVDARADLWDEVSKSNKRWEEALGKEIESAANEDRLRSQRDFAREEMQGRIEDLKRFRDLYNQKDQDKITEEQLEEEVANLVKDIRGRHNDIEGNIEGCLTDQDLLETIKILLQPEAVENAFGGADYAPDLDDGKEMPSEYAQGGGNQEPTEAIVTPFEAYKQNDRDWRNAFENLIRDILGVEPPPEVPPKPAWWLDRDPERNMVVDDIKVGADEQAELDEDAVYLNRVLLKEDDEIRNLYIPFKLNDREELDNHHILSTLFDGAMVGQFLDICEPDFLDVRVIHPPDLEDPYPLTNGFVEDNVQLALSSAKALGIRLPNYSARAWMDPNQHTPILLALMRELTLRHLEKYINIGDHPELVRLALDKEDSDAIQDLTPYDWIPRWFNRTLKRPLEAEIKDFNDDLYNVVGALCPDFTAAAPVRRFNDDPNKAAEHLLDYVKRELGVETEVLPEDLVNNNRKLQDLLAAQIFEMKSGIPKLSKKEQSRFKSIILDDAIRTGDESMCNFINSLLDGNLMIHNLNRDLSDGVVICKILDKVKPGCINWKRVRDKGEIRHKFDKLNNCTEAMRASKKDLQLKMVSAAGQDLHEGNQKVVHSLLWQVMRYKSIEMLNSLSFGDKRIEEDDILQWANESIKKLEDVHSKPIRSFKDRQLTTCVFYCELLKLILPEGSVSDDIVAYDVPPLQDVRRDYNDSEENLKKRLGNARYCMTMARREGAELFVLPEDLVVMEPKAVLTVLASLMTIHFQEEREHGEEQKQDDYVQFELDNARRG